MEFWRGKRVFVTGHTGFKGSWLSLWLHRLGAKVFGYALRPPTEPNHFTLANVSSALAEHRIGDIRDQAGLVAAINSCRPEVVIHMAAQPLVRESYEVPVETYDTNVMGTVHLLEAVRQVGGVAATVIVTSDKCYENRETPTPYVETDPMGGFDPYSSSKGCAELVTSAYARSYFSPQAGLGSVASVRAGNVIGGGDWAKDRLMADLMRGLIAGERPLIRNPRAIRPWQHVLEPLSGYLTVARHLCEAGPSAWEAWNFGPDPENEQPVSAVAELTCRLWGNASAIEIRPDPNAPHEAGLLKLNSDKARARLGWHPQWDFDTSVTKTVEWYRQFLAGADMRSISAAQIGEYEASRAPASAAVR